MYRIPALLVILLALLTVTSLTRASAATLIVTSTTDDGGAGTLRHAITSAGAGDTVQFDPSVFATRKTIVETQGPITVNVPLTITGPPAGVNVDGNHANTVFATVASGGAGVALNGITIQNGVGGGADGTPAGMGSGGAIYNSGTVVLTNCSLVNNTVTANYAGGGAIFNFVGTVTLAECTIASNSANGQNCAGGAIYTSAGSLELDNCQVTANTANGLYTDGGAIVSDGGTVTLSGTTFSQNQTNGGGGAVYTGKIHNYSAGSASIVDCTFSDNSATNTGFLGGGLGGAIYNNGEATITQCTINENTVNTGGGGVYSSGTTNMVNCTVVSNVAANAGAYWNDSGTSTITNCTFSLNEADTCGGLESTGTTVLLNDILYADGSNTGGEIDNNGSTVASATYCDIQGGYAGTGNINADPLLQALADNGGNVETAALGAGSPCLGAGSSVGAPDTDARGDSRPTPLSMGSFDQSTGVATVATPIITLPGGEYSSVQTTTITDATPGATIYVTTDGSTPTTSSAVYPGQINILTSETVKAIAVAAGLANSSVASAMYTINIPIIHSFPSGVNFFSLPGTYTGTTDALFGYTNPVLALWDPNQNQYNVLTDPLASQIADGVGYWVRFPSTINITESGNATSTSQPFSIPLGAGWNQIGDPFAQSLSLANVTVTPQGASPTTVDKLISSGQSVLYGYDTGSHQYYTSDSIAEYQGYWLYVGKSSTLLFTTPSPTISSLSPTSVAAGNQSLTLTVNGTGFVGGTTVSFGSDTNLPVTMISTGQLTVSVPAVDIATAGPVSVTVTNPAPGGGTSNTAAFTVATAPPPVPISLQFLQGTWLLESTQHRVPPSKLVISGYYITEYYGSTPQNDAILDYSDDWSFIHIGELLGNNQALLLGGWDISAPDHNHLVFSGGGGYLWNGVYVRQ